MSVQKAYTQTMELQATCSACTLVCYWTIPEVGPISYPWHV